jgi:hypothetical protein
LFSKGFCSFDLTRFSICYVGGFLVEIVFFAHRIFFSLRLKANSLSFKYEDTLFLSIFILAELYSLFEYL